ncbi:DEAD/DEAH box helicase [Azospirillum brasilense]|nr:DEAD/DEAH box helicase [Azospirillum brasilense]
MPLPEAEARKSIDRLLEAAGWVLQDYQAFNRSAALGVAVREFPLPSGAADYLLFIGGKAAGAIEAKPEGFTLSGVAEQTEKYIVPLPPHLKAYRNPLPFAYESTGVETFFRDLRDPKPRSRRVFAFHKPETLEAWLKDEKSLRGRLRSMPPLAAIGLRDCQEGAVIGLERSLAADHPRSLIQMATGAGKTFTACTFAYRMVKFAEAKRILFLVDRGNLGRQTLREFQGYRPPDDGRTFTSLYNVQRLTSNTIDKNAKVVITTIQRLYSMLQGEPNLDSDAEEVSEFETAPWNAPPKPVTYNSALPIEHFDIIVTDECHRSIYGVWRQVLEYFDAFIVGLTATPSPQTLGFFANNLVMEYPYERSVADGVNVGYEIYRIKTRVSSRGSEIKAGFDVGRRDRRTRRTVWESLDADLTYSAKDLDRSVTTPDVIRTILQAYREKLKTELFPDRTWVPKTLIFAKDDNHAEEIVQICREVFEEGNDFCKKITYRTTGEDPEELIKRFRTEPMPRIAVTVDMIATGTDVKAIEVVMFMRDVRSDIYFEQMKGRGARTISKADLLAVTPDACHGKDRFLLIDAVGVTESAKSNNRPLERQRLVGFDTLLDHVAQGRRDDDALSSLAARLAALDRRIGDDDRRRIADASGGLTLHDLANGLLDAIEPDKIDAEARDRFGPAPTPQQVETVTEELKDKACAPFDDPNLRNTLKEIRAAAYITIDEVTQDEVTYAGYDVERAKEMTERFRQFIEANRDKLTALQIIFGQPYAKRRLTYDAVVELRDALTRPPWHLDTAQVWEAYKRLEAGKLRGDRPERVLADLVTLIRFASGLDAVLEPFAVGVEQRFNLWMGRQVKAGRSFTADQEQWLRLIRDHIAVNAEITDADLQDMPAFADRGGLLRGRALFGAGLPGLLDELNDALVA